MIDIAIATLLSTRSTLAADRISPSTTVVNVKDEVLPRLVYTRLPGLREYTDDGAVGVTPGRYQLDVFANTLAEALAIRNQVTKSAAATTAPGLDCYAGTVDSTVILWISFPDDAMYQTTPVRDGQNRAIVRVTQRMSVSYRAV